jgi:hypothetical protein
MARKIIKYGGWYLAYELASSAVIIGLASAGYHFAAL